MNKVCLMMVLACCVWSIGVQAKSGPPVREVVYLGSSSVFQSGMSLDQAVAMVQAKYRAKSVRAATVDVGGRMVHEIRLRSADGSRVWTVQVDAASGREL